MLKAYLDTNIYYISRIDPKTNSRIIIDAAINEQLTIVQSDYLFDEILSLFKREFGKNVASLQRKFLLSLPTKEIIHKNKWSKLVDKYLELVADIDDLPHICSYIHSGADFFVTTNRRLTKMKIKDYVNFSSPKNFVKKLGLKTVDAIDDI